MKIQFKTYQLLLMIPFKRICCSEFKLHDRSLQIQKQPEERISTSGPLNIEAVNFDELFHKNDTQLKRIVLLFHQNCLENNNL